LRVKKCSETSLGIHTPHASCCFVSSVGVKAGHLSYFITGGAPVPTEKRIWNRLPCSGRPRNRRTATDSSFFSAWGGLWPDVVDGLVLPADALVPAGAFEIGQSVLRVRAKINSHFGASAGRADARRRDAGDAGVHRRGAATPQMPARRRAPWAAARRPATFWSVVFITNPSTKPLHLAHPAGRPASRQQNVKLFLREPLVFRAATAS